MEFWYLKQGEQEYGPIDLGTLQHWVADGRVSADDLVSTDRATWQSAASLQALAMDWLVRLDQGTPLGPLHLLSLRDLLREGLITADTPLEQQSTGELHRVGEALLESLLEEDLRARAMFEELTARIAELESSPPPASPENPEIAARLEVETREAARWKRISQEEHAANERLQAEIHSLREQLARQAASDQQPAAPSDQASSTTLETADEAEARHQFEREAIKWKNLYEELVAQTEELRASYEERLQELRQAALNDRTLLEQANLNIVQLERKHKQLQDMIENGDAAHSNVAQAAAMQDAYEVLSRNYDQLGRQIEEKSREVQALMEQRTAAEKKTEERLRAMDELVRREQTEADQARRASAQTESAYLELLRSYRDLNDRYIRLRQTLDEDREDA